MRFFSVQPPLGFRETKPALDCLADDANRVLATTYDRNNPPPLVPVGKAFHIIGGDFARNTVTGMSLEDQCSTVER